MVLHLTLFRAVGCLFPTQHMHTKKKHDASVHQTSMPRRAHMCGHAFSARCAWESPHGGAHPLACQHNMHSLMALHVAPLGCRCVPACGSVVCACRCRARLRILGVVLPEPAGVASALRGLLMRALPYPPPRRAAARHVWPDVALCQDECAPHPLPGSAPAASQLHDARCQPPHRFRGAAGPGRHPRRSLASTGGVVG